MSLPTPFYEQDGITIYCGDNRVVLPFIDRYDLLLTDPPYGIGADKSLMNRANKQHGNAAAPTRDYGISDWDSTPPQSNHLELAISKSDRAIVWGGNYFGLPASKCWLVWDKDNGKNDYADCELAWTNLDMAVRRIKYRWMGMLQQNMSEKEVRYHPTQKPVPVIGWCLGWVPDAKTILDPWMGSGTTLVAAKLAGLKATGIEINEEYCKAAVERLRQGILIAV